MQKKSGTRKKASRKRISKHILKTVPVHSMIDNDDGVQDTLTRKGAIHTISFFVIAILNKKKKKNLFQLLYYDRYITKKNLMNTIQTLKYCKLYIADFN